jgi:hypothetical protein
MTLSQSGNVCATDASSPLLAKRNTEHGRGLGAMAMGGRTDFRLAESIPVTAGVLREAEGHSRGILVLGVRSDLLALPAS